MELWKLSCWRLVFFTFVCMTVLVMQQAKSITKFDFSLALCGWQMCYPNCFLKFFCYHTLYRHIELTQKPEIGVIFMILGIDFEVKAIEKLQVNRRQLHIVPENGNADFSWRGFIHKPFRHSSVRFAHVMVCPLGTMKT